tara:strand:- start:1325 stop:1762 length:438 start_codon:yes stop_codon:yes gene_type:complete
VKNKLTILIFLFGVFISIDSTAYQFKYYKETKKKQWPLLFRFVGNNVCTLGLASIACYYSAHRIKKIRQYVSRRIDAQRIAMQQDRLWTKEKQLQNHISLVCKKWDEDIIIEAAKILSYVCCTAVIGCMCDKIVQQWFDNQYDDE